MKGCFGLYLVMHRVWGLHLQSLKSSEQTRVILLPRLIQIYLTNVLDCLFFSNPYYASECVISVSPGRRIPCPPSCQRWPLARSLSGCPRVSCPAQGAVPGPSSSARPPPGLSSSWRGIAGPWPGSQAPPGAWSWSSACPRPPQGSAAFCGWISFPCWTKMCVQWSEIVLNVVCLMSHTCSRLTLWECFQSRCYPW